MKLIQLIITVALAIFLAVATARVCVRRWEGNLTKLSVIGCILATISIAGSILFHGLGMHNIQTIFLFCVFL